MAELKNQKQIFDSCIQLMQELVYEFESYCDLKGIDTSDQDGEGTFGVTISAPVIARKLFLTGEGDDLEAKSFFLSKVLDLTKYSQITFSFDGTKYNGGSEDE